MRFISCVALTVCFAAVKEVAGHSWMTGAGGGEMRGGLTKSDSHNQRYFCPTSDLADCQPDRNQDVVLTEADQRPCRAGQSPEFGSGKAGEKLLVKWMGNGHANEQADGTCVTIKIAKFQNDPSFSDFQTLESCLPYYHEKTADGTTSARVTLPSNLSSGDYTILWYWDFASFVYSTCIDIRVSGGGSSSVKPDKAAPAKKASSAVHSESDAKPKQDGEDKKRVAAPTGAPKLEESSQDEEKSDASETTTETSDKSSNGGDVSDRELAKYVQHGCAEMDDPRQFCKRLAGTSYCKSYKQDSCGRSRCHGDQDIEFSKCRKVVLL